MTKRPKALQDAIDHTNSLPDDWFGTESADFNDLPSINSKKDVMRTSIYLKKEDLAYLKKVSKTSHVPVAQITGDIISQFIRQTKIK